MPNIKVNISVKPSFEEVGNKFKKIDIERAVQKVIEKFAFETERFSKIASPVDTGRLRASISVDIGNLRALVAPHVDYALFVHEGTRYMKGRPFLQIGLQQAEMKLFGSFNIMKAEIEREIADKLR